MTLSARIWLAAFAFAVTAHAGLVLGLRMPPPGEVKQPAGQPVAIASSLAGILGAETAVKPVERPEEAQPVRANATAPVSSEVVAAVPPEAVAARPLTAATSAVPAAVALEVRSESERAIAAVQAETAKPVETLASVDPALVTPVTPPAVRAEPDRNRERESHERARQEAREKARRRAERSKRASERRARQAAREKQARDRRARERRARAAAAQRAGSNRSGAAGASRGGQRGRRSTTAGAVRSYGARVRARILANRPGVRGRGRVVISFGVTSSGGLRYARIARSSGARSVDRAALAAVRRSAPFPRPPRGATARQLRFSIAFTFR